MEGLTVVPQQCGVARGVTREHVSLVAVHPNVCALGIIAFIISWPLHERNLVLGNLYENYFKIDSRICNDGHSVRR